MFKRLLTAFIGLAALASPAFSQGTVRVCYTASPGVCTDVSATNPFPVLATVSVNASIAGFAPSASYGTLTSTASSSTSTALPTGAVVVASNTGTSAVSCVLAVGAAVGTTNKNIIQPGSGFPFTVLYSVTTYDHIACINQAGDAASNVVVLSGGSGLPTGWGGGSSSGGGGGVVTQPTAANLNATVVGTGTFVTQATLAAETTKVIGTINQGTSPWVISGNVTNTGTFATQSTLASETTKVIGTVNQGTSPWVVSNGGTFAVQAAQSTAANLNATVVGTGTFVTQSTLAAETTKVIGTVNQGTSPWVISGAVTNAGTFAVQAAQSTAANLNATVVGTGTFATQTTLQASATTAIGQVDPYTIGAWGLAASTQNVASPTNAQLVMGEFNTTPTTITSGNSSPLQLDSSGKLIVNCTGCSSSGTITTWAGGTLGAMANYGTSPGAVLAPGVNAFVTNTNANGQATAANSSPVVLPTTQVSIGTAGTASTNVVSVQGIAAMLPLFVSRDATVNSATHGLYSNILQGDAVISATNGLYANLMVGNAAVAVGTGAQGATVPRVTVATDTATASGVSPAAAGYGTPAAAPPSGIQYQGVLSSGATGGWTRGVVACDNHVFKHITSATDTLAVQGVTSQTVYICGWRSRAAGVATWFLENTASTNANCSSTLTQITGVATEAGNTGEVARSPYWDGLKNTSGNGLCINSTGTGGVDVDIWYTQF